MIRKVEAKFKEDCLYSNGTTTVTSIVLGSVSGNGPVLPVREIIEALAGSISFNQENFFSPVINEVPGPDGIEFAKTTVQIMKKNSKIDQPNLPAIWMLEKYDRLCLIVRWIVDRWKITNSKQTLYPKPNEQF